MEHREYKNIVKCMSCLSDASDWLDLTSQDVVKDLIIGIHDILLEKIKFEENEDDE